MQNNVTPPRTEVLAIIPHDFLDKKVNEKFVQKVMGRVLNCANCRAGNPDIFEPDYFFDDVPFEFTIASDRKRKNNFIQKFFMKGTYSSDDVDQDAFKYIMSSIEEKMLKKYSVPNVHLCVLCLINLTGWVLDEYGSIAHSLIDWPRQEFFDKVKELCIVSGKFKNVFFIFPDVSASWWVWDLKSNRKACVQLSAKEMASNEYPFWITRDGYDLVLKETGNLR